VINGKQHTIAWHVDDVKSSHIDKNVNDEFLHCLQAMYVSDRIGKVKATRGYRHECLGMVFDFTSKGSLKLDMTNYVKSIINESTV
jgi:hypothetical protein